MSKRLNVYKDQKLIYDIVMESSFDKLQEEVSKFHLEEHKRTIKQMLQKSFLFHPSCRGRE